MYVVMGGTGHVGSATARALLRRGETVTIVTRNAHMASEWTGAGAEIAVADAGDVTSLRTALRQGQRALLLCPPADPAGDTDVEEHRAIDVILSALEGSELEKVVAVSTYGAQPGRRIGDLGTLWRLEQGLAQQSVPAAINRGAYYMTNWDGYVDAARDSGVLPSMLPADLVLPMVAPSDLGEAAAERLLSSTDDVGVRFIEGPRRYTAEDVADAFAAALGRSVTVQQTPVELLDSAFAEMGFSPAAAASYANMTRLTVANLDLPEEPWRGSVTLQSHIDDRVSTAHARHPDERGAVAGRPAMRSRDPR